MHYSSPVPPTLLFSSSSGDAFVVAESAIASASGCNCIREIAIIPFLVVIVVIIFYDQAWNITAEEEGSANGVQ